MVIFCSQSHLLFAAVILFKKSMYDSIFCKVSRENYFYFLQCSKIWQNQTHENKSVKKLHKLQ